MVSQMISLLQALVFLHRKRWIQKLCGLLKLPRFHVFTRRCRRTSLEIVVGSLQRKREMSLKEIPVSRADSMYKRSLMVRCLLFPGINFDIVSPFLPPPGKQ